MKKTNIYTVEPWYSVLIWGMVKMYVISKCSLNQGPNFEKVTGQNESLSKVNYKINVWYIENSFLSTGK